MTEQSTVRSVTYDLLRTLRLTTVFGNPGSTEQPFLQDFPADFTYVLALQEASVLAMHFRRGGCEGALSRGTERRAARLPDRGDLA